MHCELFTDTRAFDRWVIPHQLLPMSLVVYGLDFRVVIILIYLWETLEVFFMSCLQLFEEEDITNAIISDPLHGFVGVLIGLFIIKKFGVINDMVGPNVKTLLEFTSLCFSGFPLLDFFYDRNLHWLYILVYCAVVITIVNVNKKPIIIAIILGSLNIVMTILILSLQDRASSFYVGMAFGISVIFTSSFFI